MNMPNYERLVGIVDKTIPTDLHTWCDACDILETIRDTTYARLVELVREAVKVIGSEFNIEKACALLAEIEEASSGKPADKEIDNLMQQPDEIRRDLERRRKSPVEPSHFIGGKPAKEE